MALATTYRNAFHRVNQQLVSIMRAGFTKRILRSRPEFGRASFAVYFADTRRSLYQIMQWLPALERLSHEVAPVLLIIRDPHVAQLLAGQTRLPIVFASSSSALESALSRCRTLVVFYVNNNQANFTALRIAGPAHVHLSHGESGKVSMVSNQLKAYDYAFVAGDAAVDRILANIPRFNASHLVPVGRPQLDGVERGPRGPKSVITVLYGPTWEGDSPQMAYGSIPSIGRQLIQELLSDPVIRVIYRPHPRTGTLSKYHADAHAKIRSLVASAGHDRAIVDKNPDPYESLSKADVFVGDVSAMTMDAIGLDIPTVICRASGAATDGGGPTGNAATRISEDHVCHWASPIPAAAADILKKMALAGPTEEQCAYRDYVFGPATGSATDAFVAASKEAARRAADDWPDLHRL